MTFYPTRRVIMTSSLAAIGLGLLAPGTRQSARAATSQSLLVERRTLDVKGRGASVFGLRQPNGVTGLILDPGQRFTVNAVNKIAEDTVIHWHGQTPPNVQDGVAETGSPLIKAGAQQDYDFVPRPGTHWMHSHHGLQEQKLMAAPLIVRTAEDVRADAQEVVVLLHDFSFREPAELLAQITGAGMGNGQASQSMPGMAMPGSAKGNGKPDLNDINYDAYLANDRTLDDPLVVRTERSGRVRLRLINGATSTAFWIDLGQAVATVLAVDGDAVQPLTGSRFPLAQGQRIDLLITMPAAGGVVPILAQREGDRARTGVILATPDAKVSRIGDNADALAAAVDLSVEQHLVASAPLSPRPIDVTHKVTLTGAMMPYVWSINDRTWANHMPLRVTKGQRVVVEMVNRSPMAHPMHLHGHHFQVVSLNGRTVAGAMRDTVLVPVEGRVSIAFDADNPGKWLFHCHNLLHMATGMMTEFDYATSV
jgi:FtsP/CotA-like multicopper oxidase with cupredoxin domain